MYFEKKEEVQDVCFAVVNEIYELSKKINKNEKFDFWTYAKYEDWAEFETLVARTVAKKMLESGFTVYDGTTVDKLWVETEIEVADELLKKLSIFGYTFGLVKNKKYSKDGEIHLDITVQDGRTTAVEDTYNNDWIVRKIIAEDILLIATGRKLKRKYSFTKDEIDERTEIENTEYIIVDIANEIGETIPFDTIGEVLASRTATEDVIQICKEIEKSVEKSA